ncbi:phosphatase 1 regulatory inhibitor subunit PPP1R8-like protein [Drosera capensis]
MYGRSGLDRFKKAQSSEPFAVTANSSAIKTAQPGTKPVGHPQAVNSYSQTLPQNTRYQQPQLQPPWVPQEPSTNATPTAAAPQVTQVGGGQSTWQPPDWAIEPHPGVYYLEVLKEGEVVGQISLDKRRHIFGRQFHTCDFVLDHQSVSRQHAVVVHHKNGSIFVIDLGSAHGTFVANERLTKDTPVELEAGQSLKFAASTRTYILRKNAAALFPPPATEINLPPHPDPSDEEAVVAYNTFLNRYGLKKPEVSKSGDAVGTSGRDDDSKPLERPAKRIRKARVVFRDQFGGELVEVVGISDGADIDTEPGPIGVKEGSLVGKYESLVQITVIPKGEERSTSVKEENVMPRGVTDKLQEVLKKVKTAPKSNGIYDDLYGDSLSVNVGSSWAYSSGREHSSSSNNEVKPGTGTTSNDNYDDDDDLFGD